MKQSCQVCEGEFDASHAQKYCSRKCMSVSYRTRMSGASNPKWKGGEASLRCAECGEEFSVVRARAHTAKYCSKACKSNSERTAAPKPKARPKPKPNTCDRCGCEIQRKRKYCSTECARDGKPSWIDVRCGACFTTFTKRASSRQKFCTPECASAAQSTRQRGSASHLWKGGLVDSNMRVRNHKMYAEWRDKVFARDDYECQSCLAVGNKLAAHHIVKFSESVRLRLKVSNGITLCRQCHIDYHANEAEIGIKETALSKRVCKFLDAEPGVHYLNVHGSAYQPAGFPDFFVCVNGRAVAMELKIHPNFATPMQKMRLRQLRDAGAVARVCRSLEDVASTVWAVKESEAVDD